MSNPGAVVPSGALVSPGGQTGLGGLNAFNITSGSFIVPNVGLTVTVTLNDASWAVVGQFVYVDQAAGGAGNAGLMQITGKIGNQITLLNPTVPPAIPLANTTQSGLMKQLDNVAAHYFDGTGTWSAIPLANTAQSGLIKQLDNTAAHYFDGTGTWSTPPSSGLPASGGTLTGNLAFNPSTAGITGTTAADNASAGTLGEFLSASQASAVGIANGASTNIASVALTAGDWDVQGFIIFTPSAVPTSIGAGISTVSATLPPGSSVAAGTGARTYLVASFTSGAAQTIETGVLRVNVNATTTVYLVAQSGFASGTVTCTGFIRARRMR